MKYVKYNLRNIITYFVVKRNDRYPLSAVRDCLFNILAATLHIGGRSSIRNLRTRHAVLTGTHISRTYSISSNLKRTKFKKKKGI